MIYGVGTDICDIRRIRTSLSKYGERFAQKVLSEREIAIWHKRSARHTGNAKVTRITHQSHLIQVDR